MGTATNPPDEEARTIFAEMGYEVSGDGPEFSARRGWKDVDVHAVTGSVAAPDGGSLRCFVAWQESAREVTRAVQRADPAYDWAVIAVRDDGEYEVAARTD